MMSELPENLRKTALILIKLEEATADEVARVSGRKRSTESYYLNLLTSLKLAKKKKVGRKIYFMFNGSDADK